ncbi:helix-turn-helix domain-containing protein [Saccharopolyspora sp. CA-218241]|uniref:helix-turn-helix domain-containing protein n=1 Tax=Saccharopolyspora sp. CA-218241 TaxID=3240027 RepID=UPI003D968C28
MTVLLREAVGDRLRRARTAQSRTLRDVSRAARVSLGYLSEVERGRKEASSELLSSICDALELPLPELLMTVAGDLDETMLAPSVVGQAAEDDRLVFAEAELAEQGAGDGEVRNSADGSDLRLQPVLSQRISAPVRGSGGVVVAA